MTRKRQESAGDPVVSVVILAWRLRQELIEAISSLFASTDAPDLEVIIVSNGAPGSLLRDVEAAFDGVRIIDLGCNTGFGFAANRGAVESRGEFLLFFNDDAIAEPSMLGALLRSIDEPTEAARPIAAVGAVLMNPDGSVQEAGSRLLEDAGTVQLGRGLTRDEATTAGWLRRRPVDYASAAALLFRRETFLRAGGYDARFRPAYFEDVDLALRMRLMGYDVILEPEAVAIHRSGASTDTDPRFREFAGDHAGRAFRARWAAILPAAASADDPPDRTIQVAAGAVTPAQGDAPSTEDPVEVAAGISRDYIAWLNERLDRARQDIEEVTRELDRCRAERRDFEIAHGAGLDQARAATIAAERAADDRARLAEEYRLRLEEVEHLGLVALVKWRIGRANRDRGRTG